MHTKVSELARRYRFSVDAIYAWVRSGLIPETCTVRLGSGLRIDSDEFERLLRTGKLYRPRRKIAEARAVHSKNISAAGGFSEDQHTMRREKGRFGHRFMDASGSVSPDHPYSPDLMEPLT